MSKTPETDALIARHERETAAIKGEPALSWGVACTHAIRQIVEIIEHARSLETRLVERSEALGEAAKALPMVAGPVAHRIEVYRQTRDRQVRELESRLAEANAKIAELQGLAPVELTPKTSDATGGAGNSGTRVYFGPCGNPAYGTGGGGASLTPVPAGGGGYGYGGHRGPDESGGVPP